MTKHDMFFTCSGVCWDYLVIHQYICLLSGNIKYTFPIRAASSTARAFAICSPHLQHQIQTTVCNSLIASTPFVACDPRKYIHIIKYVSNRRF